MQTEVNKFFFEISETCKLIEPFSDGKKLEDYRSDALLRSAIERQFQIIGEALQQLSWKFAAVAARITDCRNITCDRLRYETASPTINPGQSQPSAQP